MRKNFAFNLIIGVVLLACILLWILSITVYEVFGFFNLNWALLIVGGVSGVVFIIRGLSSSGGNTVKKLFLFVGGGLLVIACLSFVWEFALDSQLIAPIVSFVVVFVLIIGLFAAGGRRWDAGDNQNSGYKNFHQRQAEKAAASEAALQDSVRAEKERLEAAAAKLEAMADKLSQQAEEADRLAREARGEVSAKGEANDN